MLSDLVAKLEHHSGTAYVATLGSIVIFAVERGIPRHDLAGTPLSGLVSETLMTRIETSLADDSISAVRVDTGEPGTLGCLQRARVGHTEYIVLSDCELDINHNRPVTPKERDMLIQQSKLAALGEMIGSIAHQWKQPLSTINLLTQLLAEMASKNQLTDEFLTRHVETVRVQLDYMRETIDDFRNYFRPSREPEPIDLVASVKEVLDLLSIPFMRENVLTDFSVGGGDSDETAVNGFPGEFKQALVNILVNAKEAAAAAGSGSVSVRIDTCDPAAASIVIEDSGSGIDGAALERIFEPFFTTKPDSGSGIGLYMARMIVEEKMGGRIRAENGDRGARFTITLPCVNRSEYGANTTHYGTAATPDGDQT